MWRYLCEVFLHNEKGVSYWGRDSNDPAHNGCAQENNFIKYSSRSVNPSAAFLQSSERVDVLLGGIHLLFLASSLHPDILLNQFIAWQSLQTKLSKAVKIPST